MHIKEVCSKCGHKGIQGNICDELLATMLVTSSFIGNATHTSAAFCVLANHLKDYQTQKDCFHWYLFTCIKCNHTWISKIRK